MFILRSKTDEGFWYAGVDYRKPYETQDPSHAARFVDRLTAEVRAKYLKENFNLDYEAQEFRL